MSKLLRRARGTIVETAIVKFHVFHIFYGFSWLEICHRLFTASHFLGQLLLKTLKLKILLVILCILVVGIDLTRGYFYVYEAFLYQILRFEGSWTEKRLFLRDYRGSWYVVLTNVNR